jgi:Kef-type K+ transport system membrane component KefB
MTPFLQLALGLSIIITSAKLGGYLSYRLGQPAVLGELLVGIILGPSVINSLHLSFFTDPHLSDVIHELAEIGVMLLMFIAGLDLHLSDMLHSSKVAGLAGTLGVVFPLVLGALGGLAFSMNLQTSIFIGLILAATSVSISAQTLMELKVIRTRVGTSLLGAAVFDDVLVILGLSIFTALTVPGSNEGIWGILLVVVRMILFLGIASFIGWWAFPKLSRMINDKPISQGLIAFVFVIILVYGLLAEVGGQMAAITGAFLAGLWFSRVPLKERIRSGVSSIAYGIFVPIFFINIGLSANAQDISGESLALLVVLTVIAVVGKVFGAGLGAKLGGLTAHESLQLGAGMMSRGEVGLIVAAVGIQDGFITNSIFAVIVGIVILTTIFTPLLLRRLFTTRPENSAREPQTGEEK